MDSGGRKEGGREGGREGEKYEHFIKRLGWFV